MDKLLNALNETYDMGRSAAGLVRVFLFNKETGKIVHLLEKKNLILFSGADIMAQVLAGNVPYAVDAMYLEFKNLADPDDPIDPPTYDRTGGIDYYLGLASSPDTDFLRVPLMVNPSIASSGSDYVGNLVTFFGVSEGTAGFWGKSFDAGANSTVYGAALVATPDFEEQSMDVVFSRTYFNQISTLAGFVVGVTWTIQFN